MTVPDEAVEAAHKAWRGQAALDGSIFEYNLRAALEAAAPFIAAQAWDEGEHAGYMNHSAEQRHGVEPHTNPYRSEQ